MHCSLYLRSVSESTLVVYIFVGTTDDKALIYAAKERREIVARYDKVSGFGSLVLVDLVLGYICALF